MTARTKDWPCRVLSRARGVVFVPIIHQTMFYDSLINALPVKHVVYTAPWAMCGAGPGGAARARAPLVNASSTVCSLLCKISLWSGRMSCPRVRIMREA